MHQKTQLFFRIIYKPKKIGISSAAYSTKWFLVSVLEVFERQLFKIIDVSQRTGTLN